MSLDNLEIWIPYELFQKNSPVKKRIKLQTRNPKLCLFIDHTIKRFSEFPIIKQKSDRKFLTLQEIVFETVLYILKMLEDNAKDIKFAFYLIRELGKDFIDSKKESYIILAECQEIQELLYHILMDIIDYSGKIRISKMNQTKNDKNKKEEKNKNNFQAEFSSEFHQDEKENKSKRSGNNKASVVKQSSETSLVLPQSGEIKPAKESKKELFKTIQLKTEDFIYTISSKGTIFCISPEINVVNFLTKTVLNNINDFFFKTSHFSKKINFDDQEESIYRSLYQFINVLSYDVLIEIAVKIAENDGQFFWKDYCSLLKNKANFFVPHQSDLINRITGPRLSCSCYLASKSLSYTYLLLKKQPLLEYNQTQFTQLENLREKLQLVDDYINYAWGWQLVD